VSDFAAEIVLVMNQVTVSPRGGVGGPAVVVEPLLSGSCEPLSAGLADGLSSSFVFVVGCDVADRFVQPHRVVLDPDPGEFGLAGHEAVLGFDRVELAAGPLRFEQARSTACSNTTR
jgi:hypothetical protein